MSVNSFSNTNSTSSTSYSLGSLNGTTQITGLASGLNTNQIISAEMALYQQPVTNLQTQQSGLTAQNKALTSIQSELQALESDAQALGDPTLFANTQAVSSTDSSLVGASATSGSGAVIGGYQVQVNALAASAQRTFSFTSPTAADTVTIDGQSISLAAGASAQDLANAVNGNGKADVWATVTSSGAVVLSNRATGHQSGSYITVSDTTGSLAEQTALAYAGQDASLTVNGTAAPPSASNTVTNAIPGVSLTLNGVTPANSPVTINVQAPAPSTAKVSSALNAFITQYNKVIGDIQTQLTTPPSSSDPTVGTLYQDPELQGLLGSMRSSMYQNMAGQSSSSIQSMLDIGVSTGATTGSSSVSQSALTGVLQLNSSTLGSALQSDAVGVQQMMVAWGASFSSTVGSVADPGGSIDSRIQGDSAEVTQLGNQISSMQSALSDKQNELVQEFAQLEAALSSNQSQSAWLTSQLAALPGA